MAGDDHSDLFMKFHNVHDIPIVGESRTELSSNDPVTRQMLHGFLHQKFIEIDSFSMSAQVDDSSPEEMKKEILRENRRLIADYDKRKLERKLQPNEQRPKEKNASEVDQDVKTRQNQAAKGSPVKEINFSRQVDIASKAFATGLKQGHGYKSACLIKRKGAGSKDEKGKATAGDVFLRIEFEQVLVTSIDWSDDEGEIKENCKFICKKIIVKYRPQLPSGKLGSIKTGQWEYTDKSQPSTGST
jgi:type VI protein secretion system component Hcp